MTARGKKISRAPARSARAHKGRVIVFPAFENYGDTILQWIAAIADEERAPGTVLRVAGSMQRAAAQIERVQNSTRHSNLANFLRLAVRALQASEPDGARYILMAAFAALAATAVPEHEPFEDPAEAKPRGILLQFPAPAVLTAMVTG
jgi:hypothetical protein